MKLLLINPSFVTAHAYDISFSEPLGIAYVAAAIEASGRHQVEVLDSVGLMDRPEPRGDRVLMGLPEDRFFAIVSDRTFDAVGVSVVPSFPEDRARILELAGRLKALRPDAPVILGGPGATLESSAFMEDRAVDVVVVGEGEATIVELLDCLEKKGELSGVAGIVCRDSKGTVLRTRGRDPVPIDRLPWPARHLLPMDSYLWKRARQYPHRKPAATILTSRACPFRCAFCNLHNIWGRRWRGRDPVLVVDEMEHLKKTYGVYRILVQDDNFVTDSARVHAICDEIIRRKLDVSWHVQPGFALWILEPDLLVKLRASGVYMICAQIETGCQKTAKYIEKKIDFDHARSIVDRANRLGMITYSNVILGFPGETRADVEESIRMAESLHIDQISYLVPIPYSQTRMYDDYVREGLIVEGQPVTVPCATRHLTADQIQALRDAAQAAHWKRRVLQLLWPQALVGELVPKILYQSARFVREFI